MKRIWMKITISIAILITLILSSFIFVTFYNDTENEIEIYRIEIISVSPEGQNVILHVDYRDDGNCRDGILLYHQNTTFYKIDIFPWHLDHVTWFDENTFSIANDKIAMIFKINDSNDLRVIQNFDNAIDWHKSVLQDEVFILDGRIFTNIDGKIIEHSEFHIDEGDDTSYYNKIVWNKDHTIAYISGMDAYVLKYSQDEGLIPISDKFHRVNDLVCTSDGHLFFAIRFSNLEHEKYYEVYFYDGNDLSLIHHMELNDDIFWPYEIVNLFWNDTTNVGLFGGYETSYTADTNYMWRSFLYTFNMTDFTRIDFPYDHLTHQITLIPGTNDYFILEDSLYRFSNGVLSEENTDLESPYSIGFSESGEIMYLSTHLETDFHLYYWVDGQRYDISPELREFISEITS